MYILVITKTKQNWCSSIGVYNTEKYTADSETSVHDTDFTRQHSVRLVNRLSGATLTSQDNIQ